MRMKTDRLMSRAEHTALRAAEETAHLHPEKMCFGNFVFEQIPQSIQVSQKAMLRETVSFSGTEHTASVGEGRCRVTCKGCFLGPDAAARYNELEAMFGETRTLFLPGMAPFPAVLSHLTRTGTVLPSGVEYSAGFTETGEIPAGVSGRIFLAKAGESLWDYAYFSGVPVDVLVKANPQIECIGTLRSGEEVYIP